MTLAEKYFEERRTRRIEEELPSALFHASTVPNAGAEDVLKALRHGYGPLSEELSRILNAVKRGESTDAALSRPVSSPLLGEVLALMKAAERTGANLQSMLKGLAEDCAHRLELEREKKAGLALQRYSLLLTAGLLTPLILGFMLSFAGDLSFAQLAGADLPMQTMRLAATAYLAILAVMTSAFLAFLENKRYAAAYYAALLLPAAFAVFALASAAA